MTVSDDATRGVRRGAGLFALPERGLLEVAGSERERWLDGMISNDVRSLDPAGSRSGCPALLLDPKGRILASLHVLALPDRFWLELERSGIATAAATFDKYIIADDVQVRDASAEWTRLALEGPRAGALLAAAAGGASSAFAPPEADGWCELRIAGRDLRVAAYGLTGEPGLQLFVPAGAEEPVRAALREAGAGALVEGDAALLEVLRVEAGTPRLGVELDDSVLPAEARLERAVSTTKGCYTGQEVVARLRTRGRVAQLLVGLRFAEGEPAVAPGAKLRDEKGVVGEVTSTVRSPSLGPVGLAFVKSDRAEPGTALRAGEARALVEALPFPGAGVGEGARRG